MEPLLTILYDFSRSMQCQLVEVNEVAGEQTTFIDSIVFLSVHHIRHLIEIHKELCLLLLIETHAYLCYLEGTMC